MVPNPIKMDDLGGFGSHYFLGGPPICLQQHRSFTFAVCKLQFLYCTHQKSRYPSRPVDRQQVAKVDQVAWLVGGWDGHPTWTIGIFGIMGPYKPRPGLGLMSLSPIIWKEWEFAHVAMDNPYTWMSRTGSDRINGDRINGLCYFTYL